MNTVSDKVVRNSLAYLSMQKWFVGDVPFYMKILPKLNWPTQVNSKRRFAINIRS